jgi:hypothetical protein
MNTRCPRAWLARFLCAAALWLPSAATLAQTPGATLFIEVRDASGAFLPGVAVTITDQQTEVTRSGATTERGMLVVPLLAPGTYALEATLDGFKTEVVRDILVQAGVRGTVTMVMVPGAVDEQVVVSADLRTLRVGSSTVGEVFDNETLITLPVSERDVIQFTFQAPGIAPPAPGSRLSTQGNTGLNSAGAREASNNLLLDGADNNDLFLNRLVVNPSLDAVQEFSLIQNTYDAEHGRSSGAQVNVVLKSGTRQVRGTAYDYFRHQALDARQVFQPDGTERPTLRKHQFGGTVGGPFGRYPTFYFLSVEAIRGREAETRLARVPTAAERTGDFSALTTPLRDPTTGQPFPGNIIPAARMSAAGVAAAGLYPLPNRDAGGANFVSAPEGQRSAIQSSIKIDHHGWRESPLHLRYTFSHDDRALPFPAHGRNLPGFGVSVLDQGHNLAAGINRTVSARVVNELRVGMNALRRENLASRAGTNGFDLLGIRGPMLDAVDQAYPALVVAGFETLGDDPNLPVLRRTRTLHVSNALSVLAGRHHVKTGGEVRTYRSDGFNHLFARGQLVFQGSLSGNPVADLLLGRPSLALLATNDNDQALRAWQVNVFAQDDWRLSSRITLNAGLRYEYNAPPYDADDRMAVFDLDTQRLVPVGQDGVPRSGLQRDMNNVAPRLGMSWDTTGRGTTVVRAGYGLFYNLGTLIENSALYFNPPYFQLGLFLPFPQALTLEDPFRGQGFSPAPSVNSLAPDFRTAYAHQASLGVDHTAGRTTFTARYVTTQGRNQVWKRNINQPAPGPESLDARRPIAGFGDILLVESRASSDYHGLQLGVHRRSPGGHAFRVSYTWSKSMDDASAFLATDGNDNTPQNSRNMGAEWGLSDFDVRHRLVATGSYQIARRTRRLLWRDWSVSGILSAQSGRPFTPRVSVDNSNTGNVGGGTFGHDRPNVVDPASVAPGAVVRSYDGRSFGLAPPFTFGNAGRNSLIGPAFVALDGVVSRRIPMARARHLDLRLEMFNALNRANLQLPDTFVDRATFGQSLSAFPARQVQLAARYSF